MTWGRQTGKTIVWIHGTGSNAYEFYGFADSFVKQGYFVIAIDYYGHGFTPIPDKDVSLYHVADDIKFLLDHLKIKKAVVGGWSRGGSIATAFYDAHPGYVSGLVLEDGGSVAWATNEHKQPIDSFATKIKKYFAANKGMDDTTFDTQFQALEFERSFSKRGAFVTLASLKKNSAGKFTFNPGVSELCGESSSQEFLTLEYRPFASAKLFGVSTILLNPRVIYRNLSVPMLILDPVSENDAFDFEDENRKLQEAHPNLIVHKVYKETSQRFEVGATERILTRCWFISVQYQRLYKELAKPHLPTRCYRAEEAVNVLKHFTRVKHYRSCCNPPFVPMSD